MFTIDLTNKELINESLLRAWGSWNKTLLKYIYGKDTNVVANLNEDDEKELQFNIKGEYEDVKSYAKALRLEADYLRSYVDKGKNHDETRSIRSELDKASADFVKKTGLPCPVKY